jgi:hypothetical protein
LVAFNDASEPSNEIESLRQHLKHTCPQEKELRESSIVCIQARRKVKKGADKTKIEAKKITRKAKRQ